MSILSDHKKIGKKLIPPFLTLGRYYDVNWVKDVIPEIIWIALVNDKLGWKESSVTIANFCKIAMEVNSKHNYAFISSFSKLNKDELEDIRNRLIYTGLLRKLDYSLANFIEFYPNSPLSFIYSNNIPREIIDVKFIVNYKKVLGEIYDKRSSDATFLLTSLIYSMLVTRKLNITENSSLAKLEEIKNYPNTDISQRVASSLRATVNTFFNTEIYEKDVVWTKYFWNKGILLEPCRI